MSLLISPSGDVPAFGVVLVREELEGMHVVVLRALHGSRRFYSQRTLASCTTREAAEAAARLLGGAS